MPWCPQCASEFMVGATLCPDCKSGLVERKPELDLPLGKDWALLTSLPMSSAQVLRGALENEGIHTQIDAEASHTMLPLHLMSTVGVRILVPGRQLEEARQVLAGFKSEGVTEAAPDQEASTFCPRCSLEFKGRLCPTCGMDRGSSPTPKGLPMPPAKISRRVMVMELLVVLMVVWLPLMLSSLWDRFHPSPRTLSWEWYGAAICAGSVLLLAYLVVRNGESIQILGLRDTSWVSEPIWGVVIFVAAWIVGGLTHMLAEPYFGVDEPPPVEDYRGAWLPLFLLIGAAFEEVFVRAYLFHRFVHFGGPVWLSVVCANLLFVAFHPYGVTGMIATFALGIMWSIFYIFGRSVPRLAIGHFLYNVAVLWPVVE